MRRKKHKNKKKQELFEEIDKVLLQKNSQALFEMFKVDDEESVSMPSKYKTVNVPL